MRWRARTAARRRASSWNGSAVSARSVRRSTGSGSASAMASQATGERREGLEPLRNTCELLQLAAREAETLVSEVVEADEAETLVGPLREEVLGEAAENPAAEGFLARQPAEQAVEQLGAEIAVQAAPLLCGGDLEELGRHDVGRHT